MKFKNILNEILNESKGEYVVGGVLVNNYHNKFYLIIDSEKDSDATNFIIREIDINGKFKNDWTKSTTKYNEDYEFLFSSLSEFTTSFKKLSNEVKNFIKKVPAVVDNLVEFTDKKMRKSSVTIKDDVYSIEIGDGFKYYLVEFEAELSAMSIYLNAQGKKNIVLSGKNIFKFNSNKFLKEVEKGLKEGMPQLSKSYDGAYLKDNGNFSEVMEYIKTYNTWFKKDIKKSFIRLDSRKNGNTENEVAGTKDIKEAKRIKKDLLKKFSGVIEVDIEIVDEWVTIDINPK